MHWPKLSTGFETRLRIVLLVVAVATSVAVPYSILRKSANDTLESSAWVIHTSQVKQKIYELRFNVSELESLLVSRYVAIPQGEGRASYDTVRRRIMPLIESLAEMTRDNADQQKRIGELKALIEGRLHLFDSVVQSLDEQNYDAADATLKQAAQLFGSRVVAREMVAAEDLLFEERSRALERSKRIADWIVAAALLAQLLLLGAVIFVSERHASHRQAAEKRARLAVERSRIIVQTMREPIAVLDPSLRVLMANESFHEFYGKPADSSEQHRLGEIGGGNWDDGDLLQRLADVAARGREIWDYELEQRSADGIERTVLINARRMDLSDDSAKNAERSILLTVGDVTARKRNEQRINELNETLGAQVEQVSEVNRELESFSYSVSHDLRAPLRHIAGFTDKLGNHIADYSDDKARHYLQVIGDASRRMSVLIENLLEYSRLGRNSLRVMPVGMNELVEEVRHMFQGGGSDREIEWVVGTLPPVMGDEGMLRQVWQNLIGNAIKYTSRRSQARIEIHADSSGSDEVVYSVHDNGTGFDMAYSNKLFGVFQRLHKASDFPGTGIGLANVRRIVSRHGGRVWAESEPDKGATFHFSLPALTGAVISRESQDES